MSDPLAELRVRNVLYRQRGARADHLRYAHAALSRIDPAALDAYAQVGRAIAALSARDAHAAMRRWMERHLHGHGSWGEAAPTIWAERKRLLREGRAPIRPSNRRTDHAPT